MYVCTTVSQCKGRERLTNLPCRASNDFVLMSVGYPAVESPVTDMSPDFLLRRLDPVVDATASLVSSRAMLNPELLELIV